MWLGKQNEGKTVYETFCFVNSKMCEDIITYLSAWANSVSETCDLWGIQYICLNVWYSMAWHCLDIRWANFNGIRGQEIAIKISA